MTAFMCSWLHLFYRNFGVFPLHQIAHVGVSQRISLKLFGREIIFEAQCWYLKCVTDRQTDAILWQYRAVHSIAREKEIIIS